MDDFDFTLKFFGWTIAGFVSFCAIIPLLSYGNPTGAVAAMALLGACIYWMRETVREYHK